MNKTSIIIDAVLAVAIVVLFVLHFSAKPVAGVARVAGNDSTTHSFAYLNLDSINSQYQFVKDLSDQLNTKYEETRVALSKKEQALQQKAAAIQKDEQDFNEKLQANAFLSRERAESEAKRIQDSGARLQKEVNDFQQLAAQKEQEFNEEMLKLNVQLHDSLDMFLKEYNAEAQYEVIFVGQTILTAAEGHDITDEVVAALNARYVKK